MEKELEKKLIKKILLSPIMIGVFVLVLFSCVGASYAATTIFSSSEVGFDNTRTNIQSTNVQGAIDELYSKATDYSSMNTRLTNVENQIYPVGSIYIAVNNTNPSTLFGGTWESFGSGRTLVGIDTSDTDFDTIEKIGGAKTHQHIYGIMKADYWNATVFTGNTGVLNNGNGTATGWSYTGTSITTQLNSNVGGGSSNGTLSTYKSTANTSATSSIQPYITVYMWKRTA